MLMLFSASEKKTEQGLKNYVAVSMQTLPGQTSALVGHKIAGPLLSRKCEGRHEVI